MCFRDLKCLFHELIRLLSTFAGQDSCIVGLTYFPGRDGTGQFQKLSHYYFAGRDTISCMLNSLKRDADYDS